MDDKEKACAACGAVKPLADFYSSHRKDGTVTVYGRCKKCHNKDVADKRRDRIKKNPQYLKDESARVAVYRSVPEHRRRANERSTSNHEAISRLRARYPQQYAQLRDAQLADNALTRSVALYRAQRDLRNDHENEYKDLYREALERRRGEHP